MTNEEFVEFMSELWTIDPDEEARLLDESYEEDYKKYLAGEDDDEDGEDINLLEGI
jgi:hypothetical protein